MAASDPKQVRSRLLIWWILWGAQLTGLCVIYFVLGRGPLPTDMTFPKSLAGLVGVGPLAVSVIVRWLVLPRCAGEGRALVLFIVGLALAEGCGLLGIFLGGPYRDDLFLLGVMGIIQFVPVYARKFITGSEQVRGLRSGDVNFL